MEIFFATEAAAESQLYHLVDSLLVVSDVLVLGYSENHVAAYFVLEGASVVTWGGCTPIWVDGDLTTRSWGVAEKLDADATAVPIVVPLGACADQPLLEIVEEVARIAVLETEETVSLTVWVRPIAEAEPRLCPLIAVRTDLSVNLETALGGRTLVDGGSIPASRVTP